MIWLLLFVFFYFQKEQLKVLFSAKEREDGARGPETVKVQLRSVMVSDFILIWFLEMNAFKIADLQCTSNVHYS